MSDQNKTVIRRLFDEVWSKGDLSVLADLMDPNCICHAAESPLIEGIDRYRQFVATYLALYGDVRIAVDAQIVEGDTVATRWTAWLKVATDDGSSDGLLGMSFHRMRDGKIAESWDTWDTLRATEASLGADALSQLTVATG